MKFLYFLAILLLANTFFAQNINLNNANKYDKNSINIEWKNIDNYKNKYYCLIHFTQKPTNETKKLLESKGVNLMQLVNEYSYYCTIEKELENSTLKSFNIDKLQNIEKAVKIDKELKLEKNKNKDLELAIFLFDEPNIKNEIKKILIDNNISVKTSAFEDKHTIIITPQSTEKLNFIASLPAVYYIAPLNINVNILNDNNRAFHLINAIDENTSYNLTGQGVTMGMGDDANPLTHIDNTKSVIQRSWRGFNYHGSHVTGTMSGSGLVNPTKKGMAPDAKNITASFTDILTQANTFYQDFNMSVTNNSYTTAQNNCAGSGTYGFVGNYIDNLAYNLPSITHVFAAGNSQSLSCAGLPPNYGNVRSGLQSSKNGLIVGNLNLATNILATNSSRGPTQDGRIKPEIVAGGVNTSSTVFGNTYGGNSGTSMASPVVAGAVALLTQRYKQLFSNSLPPSALVKNLLCNSATDYGLPGPDHSYGFGNLNIKKAVDNLNNNQFFSGSATQNSNTSFVFTAPAGLKQIKVMLTWNDLPALINSTKQLVNDLDITVTAPNGEIKQPTVAPVILTNANQVATAQEDHTNNIEQVIFDAPLSGNYTINVKGFTVSNTGQPFFVSYDFVKSGIEFVSPTGGEKWNTNETRTIRWIKTNSNNTNNIEYSINGGTNWITIQSNMPGTKDTIIFTTPSTSASGLIQFRITENGGTATALTNPITLLGVPIVSINSSCDGSVNLSWPAIPNATGYLVYQNINNDMQVVKEITTTNTIITGLDKTKTSFFSVAAKLNNLIGRRSIAVNILPNGSNCNTAPFDFDVAIVGAKSPGSGRDFTATATNFNQPISIDIQNLSSINATTANPTISYQVNNGTIITETLANSINPRAIVNFSFANLPNLNFGVNNIKAWINFNNDANKANDTITWVVKKIENSPIILPYSEGFESFPNAESLAPKYDFGFATNSHYDIEHDNSFSNTRARTFINSGIAPTGNKAISLDQINYNFNVNSNYLIANFNLSNYANSNLRLKFKYKNHGQSFLGNNLLQVRENDNASWKLAYNLFANQSAIGTTKKVIVNLNDVLNNAAFSSSFQLKFGQSGNTIIGIPQPSYDGDDGYSFDDIELIEANNDLEIKQIVAPNVMACSLSSNETISVSIRNTSGNLATNVPISYSINNGTVVTEVISNIPPNTTITYNFNQKANLQSFGDYNIKTWLSYLPDNFKDNDSILDFVISVQPTINNFPYYTSFENNNENWITKGIASSWQYGTPNKGGVTKGANGTKCWFTNLTGPYNANEISYLISPCINTSSLTNPLLSFAIWRDLEENYDYSWVEYSTDNINWIKLGNTSTGVNWYNDATTISWDSTKKYWHVATIALPNLNVNYKLRFVLKTDEGVEDFGIGVDDIRIYNGDEIYKGVADSTTQLITGGNNWVDIKLNGKIVASIKPNGNNLGNTKIKVYPVTGNSRLRYNQYYLNRNIVIQPENKPNTNVNVRKYYLDTEVDSLRAAPDCNKTCNLSAFDLGITQYSGNYNEENGTVWDNIGKDWRFFANGNYFNNPFTCRVIPHVNGYYSEFTTNTFSEFWVNAGASTRDSSLAFINFTLTVSPSNNGNVLTWTKPFVPVTSYDIYRLTPTGEEFLGNTTNLTFTHETKQAYTCYVVVAKNNIDKGSSNRACIINTQPQNTVVSPNPIYAGGIVNIYTNDTIEYFNLYNTAGQLLINSNSRNFVAPLSKGIYFIKIKTTNGVVSHHKLIVI